MSVEMIAAASAVLVSIFGGIFNYYKLKDEQKTWEQEQDIAINKKILFKVLQKRYKLYGNIFYLLGKVRDIDYPPEHYLELENNPEQLKEIAQKILEELYGEAGMFMSYETRSILLKVYQNSYRYASNELALNDLIDSYYNARRALRLDLEFDDSKSAKSSMKILTTKKDKDDLHSFKWKIKDLLAYSPRPGYPNKSVSLATLNKTLQEWKENNIRSVICLLSDTEIQEYYKVIDSNLLEFYIQKGFKVYHLNISDFQTPPVNEQELSQIFTAYKSLPHPILIHCGAGEDRSGYAVEYIEYKLRGTK
jgi:hypothetical protein